MSLKAEWKHNSRPWHWCSRSNRIQGLCDLLSHFLDILSFHCSLNSTILLGRVTVISSPHFFYFPFYFRMPLLFSWLWLDKFSSFHSVILSPLSQADAQGLPCRHAEILFSALPILARDRYSRFGYSMHWTILKFDAMPSFLNLGSSKIASVRMGWIMERKAYLLTWAHRHTDPYLECESNTFKWPPSPTSDWSLGTVTGVDYQSADVLQKRNSEKAVSIWYFWIR